MTKYPLPGTVARQSLTLPAGVLAVLGKYRYCRRGDLEPFHIEETDTSFAIDWKGHYRIEGAAFVYTDRETGRIPPVLGYPTEE